MATTRDKLKAAVEHHQAGRLQEAQRLYGEILRMDPKHAQALNLMGVVFHQRDEHEQAVAYLRRAVAEAPRAAECHNNLASAYLALGRLDEAVASCRKAIRLRPDYALAHGNLGEAYLAQKRLEEAVACYQHAVILRPESAELHHNLGRALREQGKDEAALSSLRRAAELAPQCANIQLDLANTLRKLDDPEEAMIRCRRALELNPDDPDTLNGMGNVLADQGRLDEARRYYERALEIDPGCATARMNLGSVFADQGELDKAAAHYEAALQVDEQSVEAHTHLAYVRRLQGDTRDAITHCQRALEVDPGHATAHLNMGLAFHEAGRTEEAVESYQRALQIEGDAIPALMDPGVALLEKNGHQEAVSLYDHALELDPHRAAVQYNRGLVDLAAGNFRRGWQGFEWRWRCDASSARGFTKPAWDGGPLNGRRLLVYAEQGVGDEIMFASCFPDLIAHVGTFTLECDPRLVPLFARSFPEVSFLPRPADQEPLAADALDSLDVQIAIGSLPQFYRNSLEAFPRAQAYLRPDPHQVALWRERLDRLGEGLKIGISWRGGKKSVVRRKRSVGLEQWSEIFAIPGVHFVNLQYGDCREELETLRKTSGVTVHDWIDADPLKNLDNFAAEIAALDLVISIDNSTVHMAGALGVPTWGMLPYAADWRWVVDREDTPWYPSVRFFRQTKLGDWGGVLGRVAEALRERAEKMSSDDGLARRPTRAVAKKTAVLLNDTHAWYHWGCTATSSALRRCMAELGFHRVSVPIDTELHCVPRQLSDFDDPEFFHQARQTDAQLFDTIAAADTLVINGEGTMHAVSERTAALLYIAYAAKKHLGKVVQIINHSAYPDDSPEPSDSQAFQIYRGVYQTLDFIAVREHLSHRLLRQADVDATLSFDCLPLTLREEYQRPMKADSRTLVVAGSVAFPPSAAVAFTGYLRQMRDRGYQVRVLVGALGLLAADDREFVKSLREQGELPGEVVYATTLRDWFDCIASASLLVSGRFHHTIAACCLGVPAVVLGSNTPKMQAITETFGLEPPLAYDLPDLADVLVHQTGQALEAGPVDPGIVESVCHRAERNFDGLRALL